ncbi:hypothetical protein TIFTF001_008814 [Ficus carica]|uniref:RRM domain-containing protein n=1 Tax=Ficus carica TaxID=3494 RepID=A0AA88DH80_FICCA|nr:hypothetical protein TIFTF001_008814 [Ficus carica]
MSSMAAMAATSPSSLCNKISISHSLTFIPTRFSKNFSLKPLSLSLKTYFPNFTSLSLLSPPLPCFRLSSASSDGAELEEEGTKSEEENPDAESPENGAAEEEEEVELEETKVVSFGSNGEGGRLYVGNLPYSIDSSHLAQVFAEAGTVVSVEQVGGRTIKVNFPQVPRGGEREVLGPKIRNMNKGYVDSPHKIYAGNLGWGLTSQDLRDTFAEQPGVLSAKVIYERDTGRSRGFGFVSFQTAEAARSALDAMNGVEVQGRPLRLNMATERSPTASPQAPAEVVPEGVDSGELLAGINT